MTLLQNAHRTGSYVGVVAVALAWLGVLMGAGSWLDLWVGFLWLGPTTALTIRASGRAHACETRTFKVAAVIAAALPLVVVLTAVIHAMTSQPGLCNDPPDTYFPCTYREHLVHELSPHASLNAMGLLVVGGPIFVWGALCFCIGVAIARAKRKECSVDGCPSSSV